MSTQTSRFVALSALLSLSVCGCSGTTAPPGALGSTGGAGPASGGPGAAGGSGGGAGGSVPTGASSSSVGGTVIGTDGISPIPGAGGVTASAGGTTISTGGAGISTGGVLDAGTGGVVATGGSASTVECEAGTSTGNTCDPATDTPCSRTQSSNPRTCVCGSDGTWTCTAIESGAGGSSGGTSAGGGTSTGGDSATGGGGASTGGNSGNTVTYDCDIPAAGNGGTPKPSGSSANLEVLDWAGFSSVVSYSFDDANSSQISHYDQMNALGGRFTFYLQTGKQEAGNDVWRKALEDGHELGNHTQNHTCGSGDIDSAQNFIKQTFGVTAYTMAAPNGDTSCQGSASKFLIVRSVSGGDISPNDSTNPAWIPSYIPGGMGTTAGKWKVYCIHGFTGGSDGAYQPIGFESFTSAVQQAVSSGSWVDSVVNIGSYWLAQKAFKESGSNTWTWDLPANFPPNKCLRVTVDGGTLSQGGGALAWDDHGYYEVSLDAGSLSWAP